MKLLLVVCCLVLAPISPQLVGPCDFNSMCTCKTDPEEVRDVSCVSVPLARLPDMPSSHVTHMDIVSTGLELLENEGFGSLQVESLRLISNKIGFVGDRTFSVMPSVLKSLDLSYNELEEIPFEALKPLRNLDWINLHGNHITSLSNGDWSHLRSTLTNIFIGENDISELPRLTNQDLVYTSNSQSLAEFKVLTWINMDSNKLFDIKEGMLPRTLQTLSLTNNFLSTFPMEILEEMPSLSWLYLRSNYIENIPDYVFRYKEGLDKLDLGENGIKEIVKPIFNGSLQIKDLNLDSNLIENLPSQVFRGLNLGRLHLTNNRLRDLNDKSLVGTGPYLEFLNLEHNYLNKVPHALKQLKRLRYLYLANNNITTIEDDDFQSFAITLKALSLAGNKLDTLPGLALKDCTKLSHLNVGYNQIFRLNETDFEAWGENLNTLLLRNNRLNEVGANVFRRAARLKELSLSFNKLNHIHVQALADLTQLESLEMSFSLFTEDFPMEVLKPLKNLIWLSLDNNHLRTITSDALIHLTKLQYLNLESNRLETLPSGLFYQDVHRNLKDIRLSYNNLLEIQQDAFSNLYSLQTLILNGNNLKKLDYSAFNNLPNLISLSITNNQIKHIAHRAFVNLPSLIKLEMQFNSLKHFELENFLNITNKDTPLVLNVSNNEITNIINGFMGNEVYIKTLDLSHNLINDIPIESFHNFVDSIKNINLGFNAIGKLERGAFGNLIVLEILNLQHNQINKIERRAFHNLQALQIINLSFNKIEQLQTDQFKNLDNLRILDLSHNRIRSVSKEIFQNTRLEILKLANNELVVIPNNALAEIGYTLRSLDLSANLIEHVDSTMFQEIPFLTNLNLSNNRLTILPDNVFVGVGHLIALDLSHNPLRSNFKELFHYLHKLRKLSLAATGLAEVPILPLPNLTFLNLSSNYIQKIYINSIEQLGKLRSLVLSANKLGHVPTNVWMYMPLLKQLDLSANPIKSVTKDSFNGLYHLQILDVSNLPQLERFDSDALIKTKILSELRIQTWPKIEKYRFRLGSLLANVPSLRKLHIIVQGERLTDQLIGIFNPKLRFLEITGTNLHTIEPDAFEGAEMLREMTLKITGTSIQDLKPGVFNRFQNIQQFSLDLSGNKLKSLAPSSLYANGTSYNNIATKMISGGLLLKDNPWNCDCGLVWLGHWLRRWLRETLQIHTVVLDVAAQLQDLIREAKCTDAMGRQMAIADLHAEALSCHASALSRGGSDRLHPQICLGAILLTCLWWLS